MNLWLSPHGIWYYRKVTTLPCGRRKEIKKSLRTRDKLVPATRLPNCLPVYGPGRCLPYRLLVLQRLPYSNQSPSLLLGRPDRLLHSCQS